MRGERATTLKVPVSSPFVHEKELGLYAKSYEYIHSCKAYQSSFLHILQVRLRTLGEDFVYRSSVCWARERAVATLFEKE